jgi:hypothetical protein
MTISPKKQALDAELRDLWSRHADLDSVGTTRLCEIVMDALMSYRPKELASLSEDNDVYVIGFFENMVLRPDLLSQCYHTGALCGFYRNYLIDEIRREKRRTGKEVADRQEIDEGVGASYIEQAVYDPHNTDGSNLPRVRVRLGCARHVSSASSAIDCGFLSRITAKSSQCCGGRRR